MNLPRVLALAAVAATAVAVPTPVLRVTAIPEAREDFQKNQALFTAWLGQRAGIPVDLRLAGSYEEAVHLLVTKEADLGWLGGVTTVQVMTQTGGRVHPSSSSAKDREFKSSSAAGAGARKFFGSVSYKAVPEIFSVLGVASGEQDGGAVNYKVFDQMVADRQWIREVKVVWTSYIRRPVVGSRARRRRKLPRAFSRGSRPLSWTQVPRTATAPTFEDGEYVEPKRNGGVAWPPH